jgi:hypothetical protein
LRCGEPVAQRVFVWLYAKLFAMTDFRRARNPGSLAATVAALVEEFQVPVPTTAVRVLLTDRGRLTAAEHLSRVAAYEKEDFLRTRMPPRLCSAIDAGAHLISPRWWAIGTWRLQRRIFTEESVTVWYATLAERLCWQLIEREQPAPPDTVRLAHWALGRLAVDWSFGPPSCDEWHRLRGLVVEHFPVVTHSLDSPVGTQHEAEQRLEAAGVPSVDLYFGKRRP